jgi:hypothetical protein
MGTALSVLSILNVWRERDIYTHFDGLFHTFVVLVLLDMM